MNTSTLDIFDFISPVTGEVINNYNNYDSNSDDESDFEEFLTDFNNNEKEE